jgi:hypothetical protein
VWRDRAVHAEADAAAVRTEMQFVRQLQRTGLERARAAESAVARVAELEAQTTELRNQLAGARGAHAAVVDSASWRITRPLRQIKRVFRPG